MDCTSSSLPAAKRAGWPEARALRKAPARPSTTSTWVASAKHVTNGESGSALMRDLDHALTLIETVVQAVRVPVMYFGTQDPSRNRTIKLISNPKYE
jgi:hypothetical protein